jgi:outer membrane protein assembly factor BamB
VKWQLATGAAIQSSAAIGVDGVVYVGGNDGNFKALLDVGSSSPAILWDSGIGNSSIASPAIGPDGTVYMGGESAALFAFND